MNCAQKSHFGCETNTIPHKLHFIWSLLLDVFYLRCHYSSVLTFKTPTRPLPPTTLPTDPFRVWQDYWLTPLMHPQINGNQCPINGDMICNPDLPDHGYGTQFRQVVLLRRTNNRIRERATTVRPTGSSSSRE